MSKGKIADAARVAVAWPIGAAAVTAGVALEELGKGLGKLAEASKKRPSTQRFTSTFEGGADLSSQVGSMIYWQGAMMTGAARDIATELKDEFFPSK